MVGPEASDLIAEAALALEMGAYVEDVALTVHAHPTLAEAFMEACKAALGEAIHAINRPERPRREKAAAPARAGGTGANDPGPQARAGRVRRRAGADAAGRRAGARARPRRRLALPAGAPAGPHPRAGGRRDERGGVARLARARGFEVHETDRGGDVTYHGPGQVVAYPVVDLSARPDVRKYVGALEEAMIRTCADWGVAAGRHPEHRGAWIGARRWVRSGSTSPAGSPPTASPSTPTPTSATSVPSSPAASAIRPSG